MSSFADAVNALRELPSDAKAGLAFEKLMVNYFTVDPVLSKTYKNVTRFNDSPFFTGKPETGIDLVAQRIDDDSWAAIQCKFYKPTTTLAKGNLDSFFEASGHTFNLGGETVRFNQRIIIATTDKWSKNAEEMLDDQLIPVSRIGLSDIAESEIDWDIAFPGSEVTINLTRRQTFEPRPHQVEAIDKCIQGFATRDRGQLIMACGTGKTFTALRLAEKYAAGNGGRARVLFLVPSISLLSQSLRGWHSQAELDLRTFAVCSDKKVSRDAEDIATYDLEVPVTTDGKILAEELSHRKRAAGLTVVFSTYQSLPAVHDAQAAGADEFDLVICDEAHRTTGVTLDGTDASNFVRIHDADYIKATKRLYMTATPKLFDDTVKGKAEEYSAEIASMDDEAVFGPEFHRLGFGEAVERGLLTDYKVVVMTVDETLAADAMAKMTMAEGSEITLDLASAMIGTWNGLAKRSGDEQDTRSGFSSNEAPMRRTVAFAKDIKTSRRIAETFPSLIGAYTETMRSKAVANPHVSLHNIDLTVSSRHVDGSMNALKRNNLLTWLKAPTGDEESKLLSNARCLAEGVDVPALDAIVFFNPRNSMVDVVQSVGRVMRKSEGKDYGYIILPVAVPAGVSPSQVLDDNRRFKVVWQILNALRAHDDRFNAKVNSIKLNEGDPELPIVVDPVVDPDKKLEEEKRRAELEAQRGTEGDYTTEEPRPTGDDLAQQVLFSLEQWQEAMYTKLVDKVGDRTYWADWAEDVADIAQAQTARINALLADAKPKLRKEFDRFVEGLRGNLNESITADEAVNMLSQHLITAPVFNALFAEVGFADQNPVSKVMQTMVDALDDKQLDSETEKLEGFYESVRKRAGEVTSASGKQQVVKDLYQRFFQKAFKKQSESLGIVYTPVEIVDYILRAADEILRAHFDKGLTDEGVHILDPFTGTGTFIVRLIQSGLIKPEDLARKYATELHATEIMLLAYYVAAVNIETTYNALAAEAARRAGHETPDYVPFAGIALADTFQISEDNDQLDLEVFKDNNERIQRQQDAPIHVIVGNPPYSAGQANANDLNANLKYPTLDARIRDTYAEKSTAARKAQLYDSYIRAFRWATDRIGDKGVVAFVSNGGWIESNASDGVRLSFVEDFNEVHVFNLRGNQRTAGEQSRKEGGKVFGSGSRNTVAITIGVKDPQASGCRIFYRDIGDYLSAKEKLAIVDHATTALTEDAEAHGWGTITPNKYGDWISQRSEEFETRPTLGDKKHTQTPYFAKYSSGVGTGRDAWTTNSDRKVVEKSIRRSIGFYNSEVDRLAGSEHFSSADSLIRVDNTQFKWDRINKRDVLRGVKLRFNELKIRRILYRPFFPQYIYFDKEQKLNNCTYQLPSIYPTCQHENIGYYIVNPGSAKPFSTIATDLLPDLAMWGSNAGQFFPRFTWRPVEAPVGELNLDVGTTTDAETSIYGKIGEVVDGYRRIDNITDEIKKIYRDHLDPDVTGDDIFHFVYALLHSPDYRETYKADLKKMLPHIETPTDRAFFDAYAEAGKELLDLHVNYEDVEPWPVDVQVKKTANPGDPATWKVTKPKWAKTTDPETGKKVNDTTRMIYNPKVTIAGIPAEAERYQLGSRSALGWVIDRYQIKKDKASGIVNDPNDLAAEAGNPRYIVDLVAKVTRVAMETNRIVDSLSTKE
ncbi:DEAD/DEAH box helicase [Corynebacterium frankenforstense]|uniref:DEAD/DEAH box helicase n=1 Tax=Corynebacterium frankenforstense TaxID=1230998 RepID=UPI0026EFD860|nr:DEAD/DEAH box helicase [Corynebacterium frankenforstense]